MGEVSGVGVEVAAGGLDGLVAEDALEDVEGDAGVGEPGCSGVTEPVPGEARPDVAALPYLAYQPDLAFVVEDRERVLGYVIGVADTANFVGWWKSSWTPSFAARHDEPTDPTAPDGLIPEAQLYAVAMNPKYMLVPEVVEYPAHLHIDLLPQAQGQGLGRELIRRFLEQLSLRGVPALHLCVDAMNTGALDFYRRLGFHELPSSTAEYRVLGIRTPDQITES